MVTSSDQFRAGLAQPGPRTTAGYQQTTNLYQGPDLSPGSGIVDQVRRRPLLALGLSLIAGSLLQDYFGGETTGSSGYQPTGRSTYTSYDGGLNTGAYNPGSLRQDARDVADAVGDTARSAGQTVSNAAQSAGQTVSNVAQSAGHAVSNTAQAVADTARDATSTVVDTAGDVTNEVTERAGDLLSTISDLVSQRPVMAIGLSLAAGSLLQQALRGGQRGVRQTYSQQTYSGYRPDYDLSRGVDTSLRVGTQVDQAARNVAGTIGDAAQSAVQVAADVAGRAVDSTIDTAASVGNTAVDAASSVANTAVDAASSVANTAADAAQRAGTFVVDTADQVVDSASYAAGQVAETVSGLWPTITRQVQERPLATFGLALASGMLLQPTLAPHVSAVSRDVRDAWHTVAHAVGDLVSLPEQPEVQRIKEAIVPATVERGKQFVSRDMRGYLDTNLEGMVGQASLRAGLVAAVAEQAEKLVASRLPPLLNGLSGTPGLIVLGLTGAILEARNLAQQGQGQTVMNVRTALAQSIVQNAQQQLSRYFPEFREELQAQKAAAQHCSNCNAELTPGARFCPSCGTPTSSGTSV